MFVYGIGMEVNPKESINEIWSTENGRNIENVIRPSNPGSITESFQ